MIRRAAAVAVVALVAFASSASAGSLGKTVEAPADGALAISVSKAYFPAGSALGVVVTTPDKPAVAAVAAAFAGSAGEGRMPVLFTAHGVTDDAVRAEIARVTGGTAGAAPPTVWLAGTTLSGLAGYDVRDLGSSAADVANAIFASGAAAGTGNRVLVFDADDWRAGAIAAGFGAAYGIPVVTSTGLPAGLATGPKPIAIVIGSASVPADKFSRVDKFEGADPAQLSVAAADGLVAKEHPAGTPIGVPVPLQPVSADGFGSDPGPALLAPVVAAALQADGARPPVLLVDGRPDADLAKDCAAGGKDAAAVCVMAKSDGPTTVLAITATRNEPAVSRGRLPATGGRGFPLGFAALAACALLTTRWISRAKLASEQSKGVR